MNLRQVEAFVRVMDLGSVTRAAEAMHITQSAASRLVLRLEREVGFMLFDRRKGRMAATEEAKALHREAMRSFSGLQEIEHAARRISLIGSGTLRLCVMPTLQQGALPQWIAQFCGNYPDVSVMVDVKAHLDVVYSVSRGGAELGFATLPIDDPDIVSRPIARHAAVCLIPVGHPLASRRRIRPEDLREVDLIHVPRARFSDRVVRLLEAHDVRMRVRIEARTILAAASLVAAGAGVCITDPFSLEVIRLGQVVVRPLSPSLMIEVGALHLDRRPLSILASRFLDHCLKTPAGSG